MRIKYKIVCIFLLVFCYLNISGFTGFWEHPTYEIDVKDNVQYMTEDLDTIITAYKTDNEQARKSYKKKNVAVVGKVVSIAEDKKKITITDAKNTMSVDCDTKDIIKQAAGIKSGDTVKAYSVVTVEKKRIVIDVGHIQILDGEADIANTISFNDGSTIKIDKLRNGKLADGAIRFSVPQSWDTVIEPIASQVEGNKFLLSNIPGDYSEKAEIVYTFYFDNKSLLMNKDEANKTGKIELAIMDNIFRSKEYKDIKSFKKRSIKSKNNIKYDYYKTTYRNNKKEYYDVEFVFTPIDKKGFFVLAYVYKEPKHAKDIVYLLDNLCVYE